MKLIRLKVWNQPGQEVVINIKHIIYIEDHRLHVTDNPHVLIWLQMKWEHDWKLFVVDGTLDDIMLAIKNA